MTHLSLGAQVILQFLLQNAARLNKQAAINCLVRPAHRLLISISVLQPTVHLLRRPFTAKLTLNRIAQAPVLLQQAAFGPQSSLCGSLIRFQRSIAACSAVACNLTGNGRRRTVQLTGNRSNGTSRRDAARDLLTFTQGQCPQRSLTRRRGVPSA